MMNGETGKLLELRRELEKEMQRISEDFISSHYMEVESFIAMIRELKDDYQDSIELFVDKYMAVLEDSHVLDEWTKEVTEIADKVRIHADRIRTKAVLLSASVRPPAKSTSKRNSRFQQMSYTTEIHQPAATMWLNSFLAKHGIYCSETKLQPE